MNTYIARVATFVAILGPLLAFGQDRPFSVRDDIAMTRLNEPQFSSRDPSARFASTSPHGLYMAVVSSHGLLDSDQIQSEIRIVSSHQAQVALDGVAPKPVPRVAATLTSFPHHEETKAYAGVISDLRWSDDDRYLYFKGESSNGDYRLYRVASDKGDARALTPATLSLGRFDVVGDDIFCTLATPLLMQLPATTQGNSDAKDVTGLRIHDIIFPNQLEMRAPQSYRLYHLTVTSSESHRLTLLPRFQLNDVPYLSYVFPFVASRDIHHAITMIPSPRVEEGWDQYQPATGLDHLRLRAEGESRILNLDNPSRPQEYALVDLRNGNTVSLLGAPNARSLGYIQDANRAAWSPSGSRVIVTNTFLPRPQHPRDGTRQSDVPCHLAAIDLRNNKIRCFALSHGPDANRWMIQDVSFGTTDDQIFVLAKDAKNEQTLVSFRLIGDEWTQVEEQPLQRPTRSVKEAIHPPAVQLFVQESLNLPPTLWMRDTSTDRSALLWNPNPQLDQLAFGPAAPYAWQDSQGTRWEALLFTPVGYDKTKRYPLVIQMYSFVDGQFQTDGLYPSAFAARHLASAGFVVLQVKKKPDTLSERDPQSHLEAYRSAIAALDHDGLIDTHRVGVVGFSWTCWYVMDALVKQPWMFQAATIADGFDNSYMQYMLFAVGAFPIQQQMDRIRGTSPIGDGLQTWVRDAARFHLDRVQTPVRIEAHGPSSVLSEWELYAGLQLQKKPVDLIYLPKAQHIVQRPQERLESQQGDVDWFRFWLQGYEDPDPTKRDQYARWQRLKQLRQGADSHD